MVNNHFEKLFKYTLITNKSLTTLLSVSKGKDAAMF